MRPATTVEHVYMCLSQIPWGMFLLSIGKIGWHMTIKLLGLYENNKADVFFFRDTV